MSDRVVLREHQQLIVAETRAAIERGQQVVVARVFCALGKTWGWQSAAMELFRQGVIDAVLCGVPRVNLGRQAELDYRDLKGKSSPPYFDKMVFRGGPDELQANEKCLIMTYQAMVMSETPRGNSLVEFVRNHRTLLVADEAQWLGYTEQEKDEESATKAAALFEQLIPRSRVTLLLTPCPYRSDGQKIIRAQYRTGADGRSYLVSDVEALFKMGIRRGYLARFEAFLSDGSGQFQDLVTREEATRCFSEMDSGLRPLLRRPEIWQSYVDQGLKALDEMQRLHGLVEVDVQGIRRRCRLASVIAGPDQETAKLIVRYIESCHPKVKALLAVESWRLSEDSLRIFKMGEHDVMVTVGKCHIGYDYKPIKVVVNLNATRWFGWLDNFIGRGLRIIPGREEIQAQYFGPADPQHLQWVEGLRRDQDLGILERDQEGPRGPREFQPPHERVVNARPGERLVMETEEQFDLAPLQLANLEDFVAEFGLQALPVRKVMRLMEEMGRDLNAPRAGHPSSPAERADSGGLQTQEELEREVRKELQTRAVECDQIVMKADETWDYGWSMSQCLRRFAWATSVGRSVSELEEALAWMVGSWRPACLEMVQNIGEDGRVELPEDWPEGDASQ